MKAAHDFRVGGTFKKNGQILIVLKTERRQSTAGRRASAAEIKFKLRDLDSGKVTEIAVVATDKLEDIRLDRRDMQYLYVNEKIYFFMDQETFDQIELTKEDLEGNDKFLKEEMLIGILMYEGRAVGVDMPTMIDRVVTYTEPGLRGDTTGRATKPATVEGGHELQVPLFIGIGDKLKIDTRNGAYVERVNK